MCCMIVDLVRQIHGYDNVASREVAGFYDYLRQGRPGVTACCLRRM